MKITKANGVVEYQLLAQLKQRAGETDPKITEAVTTIINGVKEGGDEAVREYTVRFDGSVPKKIEFDKDEIHAFLDQVDPAFKDAVVKAQQNIYDFHQRQAQQSWMTTKESGVIMGQRIRGLKRVGIYVPGGTAAYPSSVLMNAVPAKIAGVQASGSAKTAGRGDGSQDHRGGDHHYQWCKRGRRRGCAGVHRAV